jgi:hypothetical protein
MNVLKSLLKLQTCPWRNWNKQGEINLKDLQLNQVQKRNFPVSNGFSLIFIFPHLPTEIIPCQSVMLIANLTS